MLEDGVFAVTKAVSKMMKIVATHELIPDQWKKNLSDLADVAPAKQSLCSYPLCTLNEVAVTFLELNGTQSSFNGCHIEELEESYGKARPKKWQDNKKEGQEKCRKGW